MITDLVTPHNGEPVLERSDSGQDECPVPVFCAITRSGCGHLLHTRCVKEANATIGDRCTLSPYSIVKAGATIPLTLR